MRPLLWMLAGLAATLSAPLGAQGLGLTAPAAGLGGPAWQARFESDPVPLLAWRGVAAPLQPLAPRQTLRLLGDYQFNTLRLGDTGGLRLTGGLLVPLRTTATGGTQPDARGTQPYAGVGYSSASLPGGWGLSADLGMAAAGLGWGGGADATGGLRLQPQLRLGMSLAF